MEKQNGPLVIRTKMDSEIEENYRGWILQWRRITRDGSRTLSNHEGRNDEEVIQEKREPSATLTMAWFGITYLIMFTKRRSNTKKIEEKYIAIKECEHDDWTRTEEDTCHAYQGIFCIMDEGWFVTRAE
ncbi:hypothetical protein Tco_0173148 [Tanacetum coccineum]